MESKVFCCYEFGEFRLDAQRRSLSKNDAPVPLSARNFDLLLFMIENSGRILEHDELLDKVWAGTFVEQATLKKGISALRQILGANPENEYIKTIPRRGYSFISPVFIASENNESIVVHKIEREIIVEEFEEIDDGEDKIIAPERLIETSEPVKLLTSDTTNSTKRFSFSRRSIYAGGAVLALILVFFGLKPYFPKTSGQIFSAENVRITRLTNNGLVLSGIAASLDGNYILYPAGDKDGASLWVRQISTNTSKRLTPPVNGGFWAFAIAPDNSYAYYIIDNESEPQKSGLYKIPMLGGEPRRIAENVSSVAVSPDDKQLLLIRLTDRTELFTTDTNGEKYHLVNSFPSDIRLWSAVWTPDSTAVLCAIRKTVNDKNLFYVAEISPETGKETVILPAQEKFVFGASWLPDKSSLLLTVREKNAEIRQIWQYFPSSQEWRRVTNDNNLYKNLSLTRDGKTIISCQLSRQAAIWISDKVLPGKTSPDRAYPLMHQDSFRQVTNGISSFDRVQWLADGRLIYSTVEDGKETIFTANEDGAETRQITAGDDGMWIFPSVSRNGRDICFLSTRAGERQVWRIDNEGKNLTKITESATSVFDARILRDNSTVIYQTQIKPAGSVLYKQSPDQQIVQLTESNTGNWAISPDEKWLAAEVLDKSTNKNRIELRSLEDGKIIKTFDFAPFRQMLFTSDGKSLAFDVNHGNISQIMIQSTDGGAPYALTDFQTDEIFGFDWSADGSRIALIRGKQPNDAVAIKVN